MVLTYLFHSCTNLLDQHIDSIDSVVRVQLAQRRNRNDNDRGGRGGMYYVVFLTCILMKFCL